jgi:hypothetical protein
VLAKVYALLSCLLQAYLSRMYSHRSASPLLAKLDHAITGEGIQHTVSDCGTVVIRIRRVLEVAFGDLTAITSVPPEVVEVRPREFAVRRDACIWLQPVADVESKGENLDALLSLLGETRRARPQRLSWRDSILKYFGYDPLIDSRGQQMNWVRRERRLP